MPETSEIFNLLCDHFTHVPTQGQEKMLFAVARMLNSPRKNCTLIVKGYAGTGKTTCVRAIVAGLAKTGHRTKLLAPTGRAAKVLSQYSGRPAFTIHKTIYRRSNVSDGIGRFQLAPNLSKNTVFIVDEASMIGASVGGSGAFSEKNLLEDLMQFVFSNENCRLLLIGDSAQLPPVGSSISPALNLQYLKSSYPLTIAEVELKEVMRQSLGSGILFNATGLRSMIRHNKSGYPDLRIGGFEDITLIDGSLLQDSIEDCYGQDGQESTIVITRSNKRANLFNQQIRHRILWHEEEICAGDRLMVVRNNYFWLEEDKSSVTSFIANGDTVEIQKIVHYEEKYGFQFADVEIRLCDYPDIVPFEVKILLDTIHDEGPSLSQDKSSAFYHYVAADYMHLGSKKKVNEKIMEDPYYNALQVKFAYAVTCHKSQGGQWQNVFVDLGYLTEEMMDVEFYRWLYTAFTRAVERLFLINFPADFFLAEEN